MGAEPGTLFVKCQRGTSTGMALIKMGYAHAPAPSVTDSATRDGFVNGNILQWRSRSIDKKFYWVRDRVRRGQFLVYCMNVEQDLAEYFTKHHPTSHHCLKISTYIVLTVESSKSALYMSVDYIKGVLNTSSPWETDYIWKNSPSYDGSKHMMYGQRQTYLLGIHDIVVDNVGLRAPLI